MREYLGAGSRIGRAFAGDERASRRHVATDDAASLVTAPAPPPGRQSTLKSNFQIYFLIQYYSFQNYYLAMDAFRTY